jgi:Zn-dependent protease with chaperone function
MGWPGTQLRTNTAARVGLAAVAVVAAAEVAVWLLRPEDDPVEPAPVSESDYFAEGQLERARDYRSGQRWLAVAAIGAESAVLLVLALGRPAPARRALDRLGRRPVIGAAAAGAGIALLLDAASLAPRLAAHERAVDFGLSSQSLGPWLWDVGRGAAIGAALTAAGAALLIALMRRFGARWWIPGSAAVAALAALMVWVAPVVLNPIFNRFDALPSDSRLRAEILELADRAGVDVGDVYRVDASRRTRTLNAYVDGIGSTKRVVLYDNLIEGTGPAELRSVVAHELGHVAHDDIPRGIAFVALVAPFGLLLARELAAPLARRTGAQTGTPSALPVYFLGIAVAAFVLSVPGNQLSRKVEASADEFALELTGDPRALIDLQERLAAANLSDPDPPAAFEFLFGTHPSTVDRIGAAVAYERDQRF